MRDTSDFTLANLPYGTFVDRRGIQRAGVAIGDHVLDVAAAATVLAVPDGVEQASSAGDLLQLDRSAWRDLRARLQDALAEGFAQRDRLRDALVPSAEVRMVLPFAVRDYVDFYSSIEHATNLGRLMRPGQEPLLPNWRHLPVGYHGRSSTVVVSGTPIRRPQGQLKSAEADGPELAPTRMLDFELEVGFVTGGAPNDLGEPIDVDRAEEHIYGLVLVNDWSARDIQAWEYQPLGPFLAKSFATSISPWIVPLEALAPHRVPAPAQDQLPLGYLRGAERRGIDLELRVRIGDGIVTATNFRSMYWTMSQQLAHMTVNGTVVRAGDLYASGTVSGATRGSEGSLIELTRRGAEPLTLANGEQRAFLADGDHVVMEGWCGRGDDRVGFGTVEGTIVPAR